MLCSLGKTADASGLKICRDVVKLRETPKASNGDKTLLTHASLLQSYPQYQASRESDWWQRLELWYGKNNEDEERFETFLKWAIRSQIPTSIITSDMGMVQRLNDNGLEVNGNHQ